MSDIAIKVENLSKYYNLGVINSGTLSRDLQSWLWKKMGKDDPNRRIGDSETSKEGFYALRDLNFEIKKGERVGIIGKNGAGKSTLLKMLSQISAPTEGRILIDGKVASLLEVGTGFSPELTGRENIYLNGAILGMKKREVDANIDEIIAFSEIERHIDTPVKRYSSGMYVRLAFAVAAHLDSDILIADEVLAVGDATFQKKALGKMNELSTGQGRTVLFVSHNMGAVKQLCNRGIVLEKGKLIRDDRNINDSVSWYLGEGIGAVNGKVLHWKNEDHIGNDYFYPNAIDLICEDKQLTSESEIALQIDYTVNTFSPSLTFEFYIYTADTNSLVFSTAPFYSIEDFSCPVGEHIARCNLPMKFFNDKKYRVELQASLFNTEWILDPAKNSPNLFFTISHKNSYYPFSQHELEDCAPEIQWQLV